MHGRLLYQFNIQVHLLCRQNSLCSVVRFSPLNYDVVC